MDQLGNSLGTAVVGSLLMAFFLGNVVDTTLRTVNIEATPEQRNQIVVLLEDLNEVITEADQQALLNLLPTHLQQAINQLLDNSVVWRWRMCSSSSDSCSLPCSYWRHSYRNKNEKSHRQIGFPT